MANPRVHAKHHAVQFYGNEDSLYTTVAGFLSEGLVAGQPAIAIATADHRDAIAAQLAARLIDVEQATASGGLVFRDAHATLDTFMVDGVPDSDLFEEHVGGLIGNIIGRRHRTVVRAYGEMVDVLWKDGRTDAAIRLEILWNKLATVHGFALLCGYSMGNFYKKAEQFDEICRQHTHIIGPEPNVIVLDPKKRAAR
jgi:MEDS: MEthanogen/methylotroph, DcmR Sensory domain